ncbi:MAG: hypothetical protein PHO46_02365 [Thermoguttaceae bacterium]|nr:hypothetical protein [Thermoguttaceae bacterium]
MAAFIYVLPGALALFGEATPAKGDEPKAPVYEPRQVRVEITPNVGLSVGPNSAPTPTFALQAISKHSESSLHNDTSQEESIEESAVEKNDVEDAVLDSSKETELTGAAPLKIAGAPAALVTSEPDVARADALSTLDPIQEVVSLNDLSVPAEPTEEDVVKQIVELANEIELANAKTFDEESIASVSSGKAVNKEIISVDAKTLNLLAEAIGEYKQPGEEPDACEEELAEESIAAAEEKEEEDDDEGFAFAYSNPSLPPPSQPISDSSASGMTPLGKDLFSEQLTSDKTSAFESYSISYSSSTSAPQTPVKVAMAPPVQEQATLVASTPLQNLSVPYAALAPQPALGAMPAAQPQLAPMQAPAAQPQFATTPTPATQPQLAPMPTPAAQPQLATTPTPAAQPLLAPMPTPVAQPQFATTPTPAAQPLLAPMPLPAAQPLLAPMPTPAAQPQFATTPSPAAQPQFATTPSPAAQSQFAATPTPATQPKFGTRQPSAPSAAPTYQSMTPIASYSAPGVPLSSPSKFNTAKIDNFYAKATSTSYLNGKPAGKTFRTFDESALSPGPQKEAAPKRTAPGNHKLRIPFTKNDKSNDDNPIIQVSAVVRANAYDEYDDKRNDDADLPVIVWQDSERQMGRSVYAFDPDDTRNDEDENLEESEVIKEQKYDEEKLEEQEKIAQEQEESEEQEDKENTNVTSKSKRRLRTTPTEEEQEDEAESTPIRNVSLSDDSEDKDDERFFQNMRPFKRLRERRQNSQYAPKPPAVDRLDLENRSSVELAKEPLLTRESTKLPPLSIGTNERYAEEFVDEGGNRLVTHSELEAAREEMKGFSWTKGSFKITPYGFLSLSVSHDTQRAVPGEFILYTQSKEIDSSSGFAVDARTSRLGLKLEGPRIEQLNAELGGGVEFDFQGYPNGSKNKGGVQLRRAYVELVDKQHERRILAGQDWDIVSPGAPFMLNYLPAGFAGNIQYRRGQLRFEQGYTASPNAHFLGQIAICDNVVGDHLSTPGVTPASSGWPLIQARLSTDLFKEALNGRPITLGVSGHVGELYYTFSPIAGTPMCSTKERRAISTWSYNFDFDTPINDIHKVHGEFFAGSNLSSFCGGINQGVDLYRRDSIDSKGGWLALHSDWTPKLATNAGYGIEKPKKADLIGTSMPSGGVTTSRTKNDVFFVNCVYNWTPNFMTGLEVGYWQTDYQKADVSGSAPIFSDMKSGQDLRTEFTTRLYF